MNQPAHSLNFRGQQQLKGLYLIYRLAQNLNMTISQQGSRENAHLIWSTAFIQSYFACDTLSNYDWQALPNSREIEPWPAEMEESLSQTDMMREMVKFCYDTLGEQAPGVFDEILAKSLRNIKDPCEVLSTRSLAVSTENFQANFQERFRHIVQTRDLNKDEHALLVYKMLRFIYAVRDNVFQGLTLISDPMDELMPMRFQIYSDILLSICELLFRTVEHISNWRHKDVDVFNQKSNIFTSKAVEESQLRNKGRSSILTRRNS